MSLQSEVKTIFTHLGRSTIEAETYLAALSIGSGTAAQIAQKRERAGQSLLSHQNLVQEGILKESRKGQHKVYVPLPPRELANIVGKWATDLRSLVPQMEAMQKGTVEAPLIEVSESRAGYFRVYDEVSSIPEGTSFRVMVGKKAIEQELQASRSKTRGIPFFTRIVDRKIKTIGIFTKESMTAPQQHLARKLRYLNKRIWDLVVMPESVLNLQKLMFIYQNKVAFVFPETALVMTITHQGIADVLGATFDALHSLARRLRQLGNHFTLKSYALWSTRVSGRRVVARRRDGAALGCGGANFYRSPQVWAARRLRTRTRKNIRTPCRNTQ